MIEKAYVALTQVEPKVSAARATCTLGERQHWDCDPFKDTDMTIQHFLSCFDLNSLPLLFIGDMSVRGLKGSMNPSLPQYIYTRYIYFGVIADEAEIGLDSIGS